MYKKIINSLLKSEYDYRDDRPFNGGLFLGRIKRYLIYGKSLRLVKINKMVNSTAFNTQYGKVNYMEVLDRGGFLEQIKTLSNKYSMDRR